MSATSVPQDLFEYLDETHQRIDALVKRLGELVQAVNARHLDAAERAEMGRICQFFETEARQHHQDEERHVFPGLLASRDEAIVQVARRLTQDHGWLEENWIELYPHLRAVSEDSGGFDEAELNHAMEVFGALYDEHMQLEESIAYPEARRTLRAQGEATAGREMARRRYVDRPAV